MSDRVFVHKRAVMKVILLASTPQPEMLVHTAFRQCYKSGSVIDCAGKKPTAKEVSAFVIDKVTSGHESPIEHVSFTFAIEGVSRALSHQLVRHRIASYSQQSQRYVNADDVRFVYPHSIAENPAALEVYEGCLSTIRGAYKLINIILEADGNGQSKEDARFVLPQAAETRLIATMNCRSLLNFFGHRCCERAQWEIRELANKMLEICKNQAPSIFSAAGAKCEHTKMCPESDKFTCCKYPTK